LRRRRPAEWIGVLVIGAATGFLVFSFFAFRVCEDRINDAGTRQTVCRHVVLTDPPIAAVGLVMVGALGIFFSEVSGFGFTLKSRVDQAVQAGEEAARRAASAEDRAHLAMSEASEAKRQVREALRAAAMYRQAREDLPAGPERDAAMRQAVKMMAADYASNSNDDLDLRSLLEDRSDEGNRLAAYVSLRERPRPEWFAGLVRALLQESKPFNEETALEALHAALDGHCDQLDADLRRQLIERRDRYADRAQRRHRSSKRAALIDRILERCPADGTS